MITRSFLGPMQGADIGFLPCYYLLPYFVSPVLRSFEGGSPSIAAFIPSERDGSTGTSLCRDTTTVEFPSGELGIPPPKIV